MRVGKLSGRGTYTVLSPEVNPSCDLLGSRWMKCPRSHPARPPRRLFHGAGRDRRDHRAPLRRAAISSVPQSAKWKKVSARTKVLRHAQEEPHSAENMTGLSRLIRTNAAALENQALWHERDISHSSVERVIMPDSTILTDYVLHRLAACSKGCASCPRTWPAIWSARLAYFAAVLTASSRRHSASGSLRHGAAP